MQPQMILDLSPDEILKRIKSAVIYTLYSAQCFIGLNCTEFTRLLGWSDLYKPMLAAPFVS